MSAILDQLDSLIRLDDIAESVFNVTPKIARRKAALNTLPVPAFRINGSRKGPLYVLKDDVEALIQSRIDAARTAQKRMAQAGAV